MGILKLGKKFCSPCVRAEQLLNQLNIEHDSIDIEVDDNAIETYNVRSIPTIIKFDDDGNEVKRLVGTQCTNIDNLNDL